MAEIPHLQLVPIVSKLAIYMRITKETHNPDFGCHLLRGNTKLPLFWWQVLRPMIVNVSPAQFINNYLAKKNYPTLLTVSLRFVQNRQAKGTRWSRETVHSWVRHSHLLHHSTNSSPRRISKFLNPAMFPSHRKGRENYNTSSPLPSPSRTHTPPSEMCGR